MHNDDGWKALGEATTNNGFELVHDEERKGKRRKVTEEKEERPHMNVRFMLVLVGVVETTRMTKSLV